MKSTPRDTQASLTRDTVWFFCYTVLVSGLMYRLNATISPDWWPIFVKFSAMTGVLCVVLAARRDIRTFHVGVLAVASYAAVAYRSNWLFDALLNAYFLVPAQVVGYYLWKKELLLKIEQSVVSTEKMQHFGVISLGSALAIALLSTVFYNDIAVALKGYTNDLPVVMRVFDASVSVLTVVAQYMMTRRYREQWVLWIAINLMTLALWIYTDAIHTDSIEMIVMWSIYLLNSFYGYVVWGRKVA
jgi:nicotinamide mononucleotide transporter